MPKIRYHHDHEWHELTGAVVRKGFKAWLTLVPNEVASPSVAMQVNWDAWQWINTSNVDGEPFRVFSGSDLVLGGPSVGKLARFRIMIAGLYSISYHMNWDGAFVGTRAVIMNDDYGFPSAVYGIPQVSGQNTAHSAQFMRRYPPQDDPTLPAIIMAQVAQSSATTQRLFHGPNTGDPAIDAKTTFVECWQMAT